MKQFGKTATKAIKCIRPENFPEKLSTGGGVIVLKIIFYD
jgi:hypothetical protein